MTADPEAALLERLRAGDPEAVAEAFRAHADGLYRVALGIVRDPDAAEDVVQETFITLVRRLDSFEGRSRLSTWLFRVAHNAALQHLRRGGRLRRATGRIEDDATLAADGPGPEAVAAGRDLQRDLEAALDELPETLRAAFLLRDVEGLDTAQAAEALGISRSALKVRLHRARLALRERMAAGIDHGPTTRSAGLTCAQAVHYVSDYIDRDLDGADRARVEQHVAGCGHCRITIDTAQRTVALAGERRSVVLTAPQSSRLFEHLRVAMEARAAR